MYDMARGVGGPEGEDRSDQWYDARHHGEALRELVLEKLAQKASRYDRSSAKGRLKAEAIDHVAEHVGSIDLWTKVPPTGRKPRLSRDDLVGAALRIADAEGLAALSMRRLATELGVGTMTLYHYVRTKDELLGVATDSVMAELVLPPDEPLPDDWRAAITVIARRTRDALRRHPWILEIADAPPMGPSSVRHVDQTLQALAPLECSLVDKLDVVALIDEYVFGYCFAERDRSTATDEPAFTDYVAILLETGAYPELGRLAAAMGASGLWDAVAQVSADPDRFERNLTRLLDGVAAHLAR